MGFFFPLARSLEKIDFEVFAEGEIDADFLRNRFSLSVR